MAVFDLRPAPTALASLAALVLAMTSCGGEVTKPGVGSGVVSVVVTPASVALGVGDTVRLSAAARDAAGALVPGAIVVWSSQSPDTASVSSSGLVTGVVAGLTTITATSQGVSGSAAASVTTTGGQVTQIDVFPAATVMAIGDTVRLTGIARDAAGTEVPGVTLTWTSAAPGTASVSPTGLVSGVAAGQTAVSASYQGVTGSASVTVVTASTGTITLQPGTMYQTMVGWEGTSQVGQHEFPQYGAAQTEVLTRAVNELGLNRIRLEVQPGVENTQNYYQQWFNGQISTGQYLSGMYNPVNDNGDPNSRVDANFYFTQLDRDVSQVANPMRALLAARGESLYVNLCFVDFGGQSHFGVTSSAEYAELILAVFEHLQSTYGWVPDAVEMILEPDNGTPYNGTRIGQHMVATQARLQAAGYTPDFIAPSTTSMLNAPGYFDAIIAVPEALNALSEISYHRYSRNLSSLQQIAARASTHNLQTAHLEWIGATHQQLREDLTVGMNSSWAQFTIGWYDSDTGDDGGAYYRVDDANPGNPIVRMGSRTPFLRQYMQHVRRGAVRIGTSSQSGALEPVAFINVNGNYVVVVTASSGQTFTVGGLPGGTYGLFYSTNAQANVALPDVALSGGAPLSATIPASGVITIYRK